ncbi:MAG: hypothetical protein ACTHYN_06830 [Marinobacter sp.]|uniref:hypothetical protein n=1 Tax=Marinobacter sp. TaxID=50741 RepID=UPI003F9A06E7
MYTWTRLGSLKSAPIFIGSFLLAACGGGGGSSSSDETSAELLPGGYATEISFADGSSAEAATLLAPSGDFVVMVDFDDITIGNLKSQSNGSISGSGTDFYFDGLWQTQRGTITGEALSTSKATIKASAPGYESNSTLERDDQYSDLGIALSELSGIYTMTVPGVYTTSVTISVDGTITGSDETGCVFNGSVAIPDARFNVYEVSYSAANCSDAQRNGQYSGLGAYDPELSEIQFAGANGEVGAFFIGSK